MAAKCYGGFHIGVAFNPFKYAEAERDAQYLKLHKRLKQEQTLSLPNWVTIWRLLKQAKAF